MVAEQNVFSSGMNGASIRAHKMGGLLTVLSECWHLTKGVQSGFLLGVYCFGLLCPSTFEFTCSLVLFCCLV